jgi:hypothetical protein
MAGGVSTQMLNFTGGKNTEAGKFGAAPNTAETLVNFELQANGSVTRRLGVADTGTDISLFARSETWLLSAATSTYEWRGAGAEGDLTINVVQFGSILSLFGAASVNIDLSSYAIDASFGEHKFSYTSGLGYLFVTGKYLRPIYIKLNSDNTFTTTAITFKLRDFTGVDDGLDVDKHDRTMLDTPKPAVDQFVAEKPEFAKYKPVILKYLQHPVYSKIPVKNIAAMVASNDLLKLGAKKEREAQAKADATKTGGQPVRKQGMGQVDWSKAPKEDFEAHKRRVLGQQV